MPEQRFQLCKMTDECPALLEVVVATFPIATAYVQFRIEDERAEVILQFVRPQSGDILQGGGKPRSYLDPALLMELLVGNSKPFAYNPAYTEQSVKFSWYTLFLGAGNFGIMMYAKKGTVVTGRLIV